MSAVTAAPAEREFAFSQSEFSFISKLVYNKTGIVLADHKRDMVYGRLVRRLRALKLKSFAEYCELIQSPQGEDEMGNLVNAVTTNLTSFFRENHHFEHLRETLMKEAESVKDRKIRLWSAACSAGMEPYSMAMTCRSAIHDIDRWDAKILATDIDTNMLDTGSRGTYTVSELEDIAPPYRQFVDHTKGDDVFHLRDYVKKLISFKHLNLLSDWPMKGPFDAIFCRNVVIYFDKPTKQKLFARMADILKPSGWLYIGHSENLHGICDRFELVGRTIYRKIS